MKTSAEHQHVPAGRVSTAAARAEDVAAKLAGYRAERLERRRQTAAMLSQVRTDRQAAKRALQSSCGPATDTAADITPPVEGGPQRNAAANTDLADTELADTDLADTDPADTDPTDIAQGDTSTVEELTAVSDPASVESTCDPCAVTALDLDPENEDAPSVPVATAVPSLQASDADAATDTGSWTPAVPVPADEPEGSATSLFGQLAAAAGSAPPKGNVFRSLLADHGGPLPYGRRLDGAKAAVAVVDRTTDKNVVDDAATMTSPAPLAALLPANDLTGDATVLAAANEVQAAATDQDEAVPALAHDAGPADAELIHIAPIPEAETPVPDALSVGEVDGPAVGAGDDLPVAEDRGAEQVDAGVSVASAPEGTAEAAPDLTALPGMGPAMRVRLRQVGIATLTDLAGSDVADLKARLGDVSRLVPLAAWVATARQIALARGSSATDGMEGKS